MHAWLGSIGAIVNVQIAGFSLNLVTLVVAAALVVGDVWLDYSIVILLAKTMGGDFVAGKLDTAEWKLVLFCVFGLLAPALYLLDGVVAFAPYARIFPVLFTAQAVCGLGDNHLEGWAFLRHLYSYEATMLAMLSLGLAPAELRVIQPDLVVCLFYRISILSIIVARSGALNTSALQLLVRKCSLVTSQAFTKGCFAVFGAIRGQPLQIVRDVETAMAVLRASDVKGAGLERYVATPAWRPVLSLESIDGPQYEGMVRDFHAMLKVLPPPAALQPISLRAVRALKASGAPIDADAMARLSLEVFLEYVFGKGAADAATLDTLVHASWEWRKEIAVKGKGDPAVKQAAVEAVVAMLRRCKPLWALHGERWAQSEYYSLLMQPFILSPSINVGDIAVAIKTHTDLPLQAAMRLMHPFPVLERFVATDVVVRGRVAVRAGTQVIMFTSDFRGSTVQWPVFGAGPRGCAGSNLALTFLKHVREELLPLPQFVPEHGHRYSGRNNDGNTTLAEALYLMRTVAPIVLGLSSEGQ